MFGSAANAVGRYYKLQDGTRVQVVGVVEDGKYLSLTEDPQPAMFLPILQSPASADLSGGALEPRSAAAGRGHQRTDCATLMRALPVYIETWNQHTEGCRAVSFARGDHGRWACWA